MTQGASGSEMDAEKSTVCRLFEIGQLVFSTTISSVAEATIGQHMALTQSLRSDRTSHLPGNLRLSSSPQAPFLKARRATGATAYVRPVSPGEAGSQDSAGVSHSQRRETRADVDSNA